MNKDIFASFAAKQAAHELAATIYETMQTRRIDSIQLAMRMDCELIEVTKMLGACTDTPIELIAQAMCAMNYSMHIGYDPVKVDPLPADKLK